MRARDEGRPPHLEVAAITKRFASTLALNRIGLRVRQGEFFCLLGPSGCGKTTLLNVIGGLVEPDAGTVHLGSRDITNLSMQHRNVGIVFQSYALFPHMSVEANVAFGMEVRHRKRPQVQARVRELLQLTRLDGKAEKFPKQLSGGEQQRVALARALAVEPDLLLLDEPFSNLDAKLRVELRSEMRRIQREAGVTTVLVTHDQEEAFALGDRVGLMEGGSLVQVGTAEDLYRRPETEFVARFVGESNLLRGKVETLAGTCGILCEGHFIPVPMVVPGGKDTTILIRPEHTFLRVERPLEGMAIPGVVREVTYRGIGWRYEVGTDVGRLLASDLSSGRRCADIGDSVYVGWNSDNVFPLPARAEVP